MLRKRSRQEFKTPPRKRVNAAHSWKTIIKKASIPCVIKTLELSLATLQKAVQECLPSWNRDDLLRPITFSEEEYRKVPVWLSTRERIVCNIESPFPRSDIYEKMVSFQYYNDRHHKRMLEYQLDQLKNCTGRICEIYKCGIRVTGIVVTDEDEGALRNIEVETMDDHQRYCMTRSAVKVLGEFRKPCGSLLPQPSREELWEALQVTLCYLVNITSGSVDTVYDHRYEMEELWTLICNAETYEDLQIACETGYPF